MSIVTCVGGEMQEERKIYLRAVGDGNESHPPEHHLIDSEKDVRRSLVVRCSQDA